jgi:hypothetical protein
MKSKIDSDIVAVQVFWKSDTLGGFGLIFPVAEQAREIAQMMVDLHHKFKTTEPDQDHFLTVEVWEQMKHLCSVINSNDSSEEDNYAAQLLACSNVYILEQEGILKPDEYNGCVFSHDLTQLRPWIRGPFYPSRSDRK